MLVSIPLYVRSTTSMDTIQMMYLEKLNQNGRISFKMAAKYLVKYC
jgi:hypothetical protein